MAKFCPECGKPLEVAGAHFCSSCGGVVDPIAVFGSPAKKTPGQEKSPFLAAMGSCFLPGLGQVYDGENGKGLAVFFGTLFGFFILLIPGLAVWIYGMYDAYSTARRMNSGLIPYKPAKPAHIILFIFLAVAVVVMIYLAVMALVSSLLQSVGGSDFSSLLNSGL